MVFVVVDSIGCDFIVIIVLPLGPKPLAMSQRTSRILARGPRELRKRHSFTYPDKEGSYYGPDFLNVEKGRSSSFSSPPRVPAEPNSHEKRPHPYPPIVKMDYQYYKDCEEDPEIIKFRDRIRNLCSLNNEKDAKFYRKALNDGLIVLRLVNEYVYVNFYAWLLNWEELTKGILVLPCHEVLS